MLPCRYTGTADVNVEESSPHLIYTYFGGRWSFMPRKANAQSSNIDWVPSFLHTGVRHGQIVEITLWRQVEERSFAGKLLASLHITIPSCAVIVFRDV